MDSEQRRGKGRHRVYPESVPGLSWDTGFRLGQHGQVQLVLFSALCYSNKKKTNMVRFYIIGRRALICRLIFWKRKRTCPIL